MRNEPKPLPKQTPAPQPNKSSQTPVPPDYVPSPMPTMTLAEQLARPPEVWGVETLQYREAPLLLDDSLYRLAPVEGPTISIPTLFDSR